MPRVESNSARHAKRDSQQRQRLSIGGSSLSFARTEASTSSPVAGTSISPRVRFESAAVAIPPAVSLKITLPARPGWRHPAELAFIDTCDDMSIIRLLPLRVLCADGSTVVLPSTYRTPLLWVAKFLWSSLEIVLTAEERPAEWNEDKYAILHVARQCAGLIDSARASAESGGKGGIDNAWRCAMFDRALLRYWHGWLNVRDDFVTAFWEEFGEEDFESDVLKLQWSQWAIKGQNGFKLTKQELVNGISAGEFMEGFFVDENRGTFEWIPLLPDPPQSPVQGEIQKRPARCSQRTESPGPAFKAAPHVDSGGSECRAVSGEPLAVHDSAPLTVPRIKGTAKMVLGRSSRSRNRDSTPECMPLPVPALNKAGEIEMERVVKQSKTSQEDGAGFHTPDMDDDDGLELLYPDPSAPQSRSQSTARFIQRSRFSSRSMSQPASALSAARFAPESSMLFPGAYPNPDLLAPQSSSVHDFLQPASQQQLVGSPNQQLLSLGLMDPNVLARITQSWGDEMFALRDEVVALRAELVGNHAPAMQLEQRIRVLEERTGSQELMVPNSGAMEYCHPLQHLLYVEEEALLNVDVDDNRMPDGAFQG
ncbi:hypothetical protein B0H14DRAFT_2947495 [Mycena olivaceomarginata]|nr:hypothetical protein B0H14DRAFT_2947495 [Mycena olivaceomarginata]